MIELVEKIRPEGLWPGDMKDGDIGVIVAWPVSVYVGQIVQRYQDQLISVGIRSAIRWNTFKVPNSCRVRLLKKGETLIVT